jgi:tRNA threonylcarbamoyladenosine biosynthesis protein TsaB
VTGGPRTLLALDAAGSACSAALWRDGALLARRFEAMRRGQSERLVPMIETVMSEAGLAYDSLDAIAVTTGPGGFTGVRIGLATARGLALACGRPLIGVSSFEAVAAAVAGTERHGRTLAVLLDAKRTEVYAQAFDSRLRPRGAARAVLPSGLDAFLPPGPITLAGDAVTQGQGSLEAAGRDLTIATACGLADAGVVAGLAATRPLPGPGAPGPQPIYLRDPDVSLPANPGNGNP